MGGAVSFGYDPYTVMTIVENTDGTFSFLCDSCGGGWRQKLDSGSSLRAMRIMFDGHVRVSHELTREDTATWHKGH